MIHYQLRCSAEHSFDGWFKDSTGFEAQVSRGLVCCPECGDTAVLRALMAPSIGRKRGAEPKPAADAPAAPPSAVAAGLPGHIPDQLKAALMRLRGEVERNGHYVGRSFAEEARKIHRGETEQRAIYGESTDAEADALAEDGIGFTRIPWLPRADG